MKTTIELPEDLLRRAKMLAMEKQTTLKELVCAGLEYVLDEKAAHVRLQSVRERIQQGYHLGGRALSRNAVHED